MDTGAERDFSCGKCGRVHPSCGWGELELIERMHLERLREIVVAWPAEMAIEIRRCNGCGGSIARKCRAEAR